MATKTIDPRVPVGYDASQFPSFAVTVDVVVLTVSDGRLHVLLVRRGVAPFEGLWAIPGGFKRPAETLDEAAKRELVEETGVDGASLLTQFGAYGDPERDPRMNVVTIAYLAVLREIGAATRFEIRVIGPAFGDFVGDGAQRPVQSWRFDSLRRR